MVPELAKAAVAAGADGLMIEVHNNPAKAKCDGAQSLTPDQFDELMQFIGKEVEFFGKKNELNLPARPPAEEPPSAPSGRMFSVIAGTRCHALPKGRAFLFAGNILLPVLALPARSHAASAFSSFSFQFSFDSFMVYYSVF